MKYEYLSVSELFVLSEADSQNFKILVLGAFGHSYLYLISIGSRFEMTLSATGLYQPSGSFAFIV